jgi:hypothetical protein
VIVEKHRPILVEVAPGELVDKITILEIKANRIADEAKRRHVVHELNLLQQARDQAAAPSAEMEILTAKLRAVNESLWDIEDAIRRCERQQDFGPKFIELARAVYHTNDERALLKRQINELLGSAIVEEKAYVDYASGTKSQ